MLSLHCSCLEHLVFYTATLIEWNTTMKHKKAQERSFVSIIQRPSCSSRRLRIELRPVPRLHTFSLLLKQTNASVLAEMLCARPRILLPRPLTIRRSFDPQLSIACRLSSSLAAVLQRIKQVKDLDQTALPDVRRWLAEFRDAPSDKAIDHSKHCYFLIFLALDYHLFHFSKDICLVFDRLLRADGLSKLWTWWTGVFSHDPTTCLWLMVTCFQNVNKGETT